MRSAPACLHPSSQTTGASDAAHSFRSILTGMLPLGMLGIPQAWPVSRGACREAVLASSTQR